MAKCTRKVITSSTNWTISEDNWDCSKITFSLLKVSSGHKSVLSSKKLWRITRIRLNSFQINLETLKLLFLQLSGQNWVKNKWGLRKSSKARLYSTRIQMESVLMNKLVRAAEILQVVQLHCGKRDLTRRNLRLDTKVGRLNWAQLS